MEGAVVDVKLSRVAATAGAKLFPNCAEKVDAAACQVNYFTVPLTEVQAMLAMRRELAYGPSGVDIRSYPEKCDSRVPVNANRPDDPRRCALSRGIPVPLVPVSEFKNASPILHASYAVFEQVRTLLAVGQKLQDMQLRELGKHQPAAEQATDKIVTIQI